MDPMMEQELWHEVRESLLSLQSALERWSCQLDLPVAKRTHNGFMARGVGLAVRYWHESTEDLVSSDASLREQLSRLIMSDYFAGGLNDSVCEGLRMSSRLVCAVYETASTNA